MTDQDAALDGFPAVERGSIKVFPDGLPAEWFKFLDESPWFIKGMSPEHAMQIASMLATDAFLTIQIWANEAWRQRELRRELAAALREEREKRRFWNNRNYQLVDKVRDQDWHLAYERAVREVVEAALVYEHEMHIMHDDALRVAQGLIESEGQALAAALDEADRLKVCGNCRHCEAHGLFCVEATLLGYDGARDEGWPNWYKDGSFNVHVLLGDHCHFIPSRWTPTTEAPE